MKIAIIGSGNVGGALAKRFIQAKHTVLMGVNFPLSEKSIKLATEIGEDRFNTIEGAVSQSEIIVISIPAETILTNIPKFGDLTDKIIIDTTNAVRNKPEPYNTAFEAIKKTTGAQHVVKCFNSTGYENLLNPVYRLQHPYPNEVHLDMFAAGDSMHAKKIAGELARQIGFHTCMDFGGDDRVELLEQFAISWINLAIFQKQGRDIGIKIIHRL